MAAGALKPDLHVHVLSLIQLIVHAVVFQSIDLNLPPLRKFPQIGRDVIFEVLSSINHSQLGVLSVKLIIISIRKISLSSP